MWSYRIIAPYQFERTSIAEKTPDSLADGQVLLRFLAAGVCGSDMPAFRGVRGKLPGDEGRSGAEKDGYPIHEVVGEVIASRHRQHRPGDRVVGWASAFDGLMERVVTDGNQVAAYGARSGCCSRVRPRRRAPVASPASTRSTAQRLQ
jgi:L-iditol 2-dehydrogenase